ncbi:MAG: 50S ribosomal protein L23 [Deltaproteobacteria bacterium]|nr:50S ribosomal protein L23 [Deltaproteobacteria bacterium]
MNPYSVLVKPVLSEKSMTAREREEGRKYTFLIHDKASKIDVKKAVEKIFEVNVVSINTMVTRGKSRRRGMVVSQLPSKKKAIVTLKSGQKIKVFEDR